MKALGKYIVIKKIVEEKTSKSGLVLTASDLADLRYSKGKVQLVGTEIKYINEGDIVYYDKVAAFDIRLDGVMQSIIKENDVVVCTPD
jgi:co-chaperonin GroES (HSP10)